MSYSVRRNMVDIAMCSRRDCKKKWSCFRYLAFPDEYQAYLMIDKVDLSDGCDKYWRCNSRKELRIMNRLNR